MNPIEVIFSGLAYSFSLESLKMCLIFCSQPFGKSAQKAQWNKVNDENIEQL